MCAVTKDFTCSLQGLRKLAHGSLFAFETPQSTDKDCRLGVTKWIVTWQDFVSGNQKLFDVHFFLSEYPRPDFSLLLSLCNSSVSRKPLCVIASNVKSAKTSVGTKPPRRNAASSAACNDRTSVTSCVSECGAQRRVPCISSKYRRLSGSHKRSSAMKVRCSPGPFRAG